MGSSGSGKSTFAWRLGKVLNIDVIHLDSHYWKPNWVETSVDQFEAEVNRLVEKESWIMDGNYTSTLHHRLAYADTVIFLDLGRVRCVWRCVGRYLKHRGENRPELPEDCNEKIDLDFLKWIWNYPRRSRSRILQMLDHQSKCEVFILHGARQIDTFIAKMETS